jgi:hypothetical protein
MSLEITMKIGTSRTQPENMFLYVLNKSLKRQWEKKQRENYINVQAYILKMHVPILMHK